MKVVTTAENSPAYKGNKIDMVEHAFDWIRSQILGGYLIPLSDFQTYRYHDWNLHPNRRAKRWKLALLLWKADWVHTPRSYLEMAREYRVDA